MYQEGCVKEQREAGCLMAKAGAKHLQGKEQRGSQVAEAQAEEEPRRGQRKPKEGLKLTSQRKIWI